MFHVELKGVALDAYNRMVREMISKATRELGLGADGLVIRPLRPEDLGLPAPAWSFNLTAPNSWNTAVNTTIADNRFVGINGIFHNEALGRATQVKITRKGSETRYWDVTWIRDTQNKIAFADDPVIFDQNTSVKIEIYCTTASTLTDFGFLGAVVEKRGMLINP